MRNPNPFRRLLSSLLAACFLFSLSICSASADEETLPEETAAVTEPDLPETEPPQTQPEETEPVLPEDGEPETIFSSPYKLCFGLLHSHTDLSDGLGSVEAAFSHAAAVDGLDFFAVTDHSNSLDDAEWTAGRAAAAAVTGEDFLGIFGYEMTWQESKRIGHIVTFGTDSFLSREQAEFSNPDTALERYYQALTRLPGSVSMLCHPGKYYGDFHSFGQYQWEYDQTVHLLEVVSGQEAPAWDQYTRALDAGWHLAPSANQNNHSGQWGDESSVRTVVLADSLSIQSLFSAIRHRRVYATEDSDLHLYYDLDGYDMGSIIPRADHPEISLLAYDPTGEAIGTVEVVTEGGMILARETASENDVFLTLPVSGGFRYYYLRITQPDGDQAVTAPVWVEGFENMGILDFSANTDTPVQDQPLTLSLSLYNDESVELSLEAVELYADGQLVHTMDDPGVVAAHNTLALSFSYSHSISGETELQVLVRGRVQGEQRSYEASLPLRFRSGVAVTGLIVDGSHSNAGLDTLDRFCTFAEEERLDLTLVTGDLPQGGELLLIPDPQTPFEPHFLQDVQRFAEGGGDLILWGKQEILEPLLQTLGVTMRLGSESLKSGSCEVFNTASPWCGALAQGQYFSHPECTSVEPGEGLWLVRDGADGPVLLACEKTPWGGTVFLSSCPFLLDAQMPESRSVWELPRANETILRTILGTKQRVLARQAIQSVRNGTSGTTYRIKGYVTAGTSDPCNRFPDTIYLQDDTGGIAVTGFTAEGIQVGTPLEIIGTLGSDGKNVVLEYDDHRLLSEAYYRWVPGTVGCETAADYKLRGGTLVQVEGRVSEIIRTGDRKGITRLLVTDFLGDTAIVEIEEYIFSGATGENRLAEDIRNGRTVRAMGLVHINEAGETVIRARNCDEVVYLPPTTDLTNPDTSDRAWLWP